MATSNDSGSAIKPAYLIALALLAVVAGGVWWMNREKPLPTSGTLAEDPEYPMACGACGNNFGVKRSQQATWPSADSGFECPKCKKMRGMPNKSESDTFSVPESVGGGGG